MLNSVTIDTRLARELGVSPQHDKPVCRGDVGRPWLGAGGELCTRCRQGEEVGSHALYIALNYCCSRSFTAYCRVEPGTNRPPEHGPQPENIVSLVVRF